MGSNETRHFFFSISQTPGVAGDTPTEKEMFDNYFEQLKHADSLGFGVGWIAQAHLSTETQKSNSQPVVPHWQGEVGLCTDFTQLALESFRATKKYRYRFGSSQYFSKWWTNRSSRKSSKYCSVSFSLRQYKKVASRF